MLWCKCLTDGFTAPVSSVTVAGIPSAVKPSVRHLAILILVEGGLSCTGTKD